jgi:hypothetical protein
VFVADSQIARVDANEESLDNLKENLEEYGLSLDQIPYVIQYNKRDLPAIMTVEELRASLNPDGVPEFEAVACDGRGVFETLKAVAKLVFMELKKGGTGPAAGGRGVPGGTSGGLPARVAPPAGGIPGRPAPPPPPGGGVPGGLPSRGVPPNLGGTVPGGGAGPGGGLGGIGRRPPPPPPPGKKGPPFGQGGS